MTLGALTRLALSRPQTAADTLADALREAIVNGELGGGDALRQDELAAHFGVSRMPVRDALRQLETEGLVTIHPTRGCFVSRLDPTDIQEVFALRSLVEAEALQLAFPSLTSQTLDEADAVLERIDRCRHPGELTSLNRTFHMLLYRDCGSTRLTDLIATLHGSADRYVRLFMVDAGYGRASQDDHRAILAACRAGDPDAAVGALKLHLERGGEQIAETFAEKNGD